MKASRVMLVIEKMMSREENPGFLRTTARRPMVCMTLPLLLDARVSRNATEPTMTVMPRSAWVTNTPLHEVNLRSSAPMTGATAGEMTTIDCTIASIDSRFLP